MAWIPAHHTRAGGAAMYLDGILEGTWYFYQVTAPQRATLSLTRPVPSAGWMLGDLLRKCNHPVSSATRAHVHEWLSQMVPSGLPTRFPRFGPSAILVRTQTHTIACITVIQNGWHKHVLPIRHSL